jgi:HlyD family secretion protein
MYCAKADTTVKKLLFVLVLMGGGLALAAYFLSHPSHAITGEEFKTVPVEWGTIVDAVNATGILQPRETTAVGSPQSGEVVKIYPEADFNQVVAKDQPLLELDARAAKMKQDQARIAIDLAKAGVEQAEASRDAAEIALKRQQKYLQEGLTKNQEVDQATLVLRTAEATLKMARVKVQEAEEALRAADLGVELTTVKAPASGTIIDRKVVLGQLIAPPVSAQLFLIASDLKQMRLHAQVAEGDVSRVRKGQYATFTVYAYSDENDSFEGTVEMIRPMSVNVQGASFYNVIIDVANREARQTSNGKAWMLLPGMTATVDIQCRKHPATWKVPNAALNFQLDDFYQSPEAKAKLRQWEGRKDLENWKHAWIVKNKKPWPLFVRLGGKNQAGDDTGIKDGQFTEVLEWDPEMDQRPDPNNPGTFPQVIIEAPPVNKPGIFDKPTLKFS